MGHALRWGNWVWAKLVEAAFGTSHLSDIGCTMRLVSGPAVRSMQPLFTVSGGAFGPEMLLLSVIGGWRSVQLPVSYHPRSGHRGTTESPRAAGRIALEMLRLVGRYWIHRRRISAALESAGAAETRSKLSDDRRPGGEPTHMFPRPWRQRREADAAEGDEQQVAVRDD